MKKIPYHNLTEAEQKAVAEAVNMQKKAYAPYSQFPVGAVAVSNTQKYFCGCNIESSDFTLTSHAEMTAINNMVTQGEQILAKIYIALKSGEAIPVPCGLCRQKITEFALNDQIEIITINNSAAPPDIYKFTLQELYPYPFSKKYL